MTIIQDLLCQIDTFHAPPHTSNPFPLHCRLQFAFAERFACGLISLPQKHCVSNRSHSVSMHSKPLGTGLQNSTPKYPYSLHSSAHISSVILSQAMLSPPNVRVFGLNHPHHPKSGLPNNHCSAIVFRLGLEVCCVLKDGRL